MTAAAATVLFLPQITTGSTPAAGCTSSRFTANVGNFGGSHTVTLKCRGLKAMSPGACQLACVALCM